MRADMLDKAGLVGRKAPWQDHLSITLDKILEVGCADMLDKAGPVKA